MDSLDSNGRPRIRKPLPCPYNNGHVQSYQRGPTPWWTPGPRPELSPMWTLVPWTLRSTPVTQMTLNSRSAPVRAPLQRPASTQTPRPTLRPFPYSAPKAESIPVHDVGSSRSDLKFDSAVKIQKVIRGFLVRKNVKELKSIAKSIDEVAERIQTGDSMELIVRDWNEGVGVQEKLMNMHLQLLDDISTADYGVRVCWKRLIKRVIALQEEIEEIAAVDSHNDQSFDSARQVNGNSETAYQDHAKSCQELCVEESGNESSSSDSEPLEMIELFERSEMQIMQIILSSLPTRAGHYERRFCRGTPQIIPIDEDYLDWSWY